MNNKLPNDGRELILASSAIFQVSGIILLVTSLLLCLNSYVGLPIWTILFIVGALSIYSGAKMFYNLYLNDNE
jgi:hypothetical protein